MADPVRILLLADTHLGFDLPLRPRVERRRRGHDFQANYEAALAPALAQEAERRVDVVVHGGDLFHRPGTPPSLAYQGLEPLVRVAEAGIPVLLVPGNHERARIPHPRFAAHPRVHIFHRPQVVDLEVRGARLRFVGFPFQRRVRGQLGALLDQAGWHRDPEAPTFLCMHQCFEGATVGPSDFTFTSGDDVIGARELPRGLSAVLSGHIHRHQVLTRDLDGEALRSPVLYPGSVERTALAERDEPKGYMMVELDPAAAFETDRGHRSPGGVGGEPLRWTFHRLPARPMVVRALDLEGKSGVAVEAGLRAIVEDAPPDAVLRIRTHGTAREEARRVLTASSLRRIAPTTMNLEIREAGARFERTRRHRPKAAAQPELGL